MFSIYIYTQSTTRPMFVVPLMRLVRFACLRPTTDEGDELFFTEVCDGIAFYHCALGL